ncbi:MAG: arginyltransferase [Gammaproteobacteria bacterium]|nr:arginyltransferase [Gammaproteobacteria bacterium]MDP2141194.1 arginyltransferase [Gammaproteobacteria bacterium]MDP2349132.1 arginyltransferase [Gammaproteobacteria bacterium]
MNSEDLATLRFFQTSPHPCSYLPGQEAATVFMDPEQPLTVHLYSRLITAGFRRSGTHLYRPGCAQCQACISCRVRVRDFQYTRRFKRVWQRNQDLVVREVQDLSEPECFDLYASYINTRHRDGDMYPPTPEQFQSFIRVKAASTRFYGFYSDNALVAVCVLDELDHCLSAMYTFFDPELAERSLGVFAILWQIEKTRRLNLPYLYLGYWIKSCDKMRYKTEYRPLELFIAGKWTLLS